MSRTHDCFGLLEDQPLQWTMTKEGAATTMPPPKVAASQYAPTTNGTAAVAPQQQFGYFEANLAPREEAAPSRQRSNNPAQRAAVWWSGDRVAQEML